VPTTDKQATGRTYPQLPLEYQ